MADMLTLAIVMVLTVCSLQAEELCPVVIAEPGAAATTGTTLPLLIALPQGDPRIVEAEKLLDNEAARFIRRLLSRAWRMSGRPEADAPPPLPIVLKPGGNHAKMGHRLQRGNRITEHPDQPHVLLELNANRMSHTMLHEGGHAVEIVLRGKRRASHPAWSATLHSTFAITDPLTAFAEGFATHLETLRGHYGSEPESRGYYLHHDAFFGQGPAAEMYFPARDLFNFAQNWSRYQAVRDGTTAFVAAPSEGGYPRLQYDPARDLATPKTANGMLASEGVAATVMFWLVANRATGCKPGGGLDQPGLEAAEEPLLRAIRDMTGETSAYRPDLVDLVEAFGPKGSADREYAVRRFVDVTRAVTAGRGVRKLWREFYLGALVLDQKRLKPPMTELDSVREELAAGALADATVLRRALGPILPVRYKGLTVSLPGLGESFPAELDLNAFDEGFAGLLAAAPERRAALLTELERAPFASLADAEKRLGHALGALGLERVE